MKTLILFISFVVSLCAHAQNTPVNTLLPGKYETIIKDNQLKWERGDIIILEGGKYKLSTSNDVGDYKFSITAQRIFFTSGPLKSMFARTSFTNDTTAIILPYSENEQMGNKLTSEVWCYYRN